MGIGIIGMRNGLGTALLIASAAVGLGAQTVTAITGMVKDGASQAAIAGATVTLLSDPTATATTGADGAFTLTLTAPIGVRQDTRDAHGIAFTGSELSLTVAGLGARVAVELFDLNGNAQKTLHDSRLPGGRYAFPIASAGLPAGVYAVRARVGGMSRTFKASTLAAPAGKGGMKNLASPYARLAKAAAAGEFLVVSKEGYLKKHHAVAALDQAQTVALTAFAAATGNLKIFSDQAFPEIDWANGVIYAWELTSTLMTDSTNNLGFGGSRMAIKVATAEGSGWNGWAFHVAKQDNETQPTADLSPYKGGKLHLAVKGTMPTLGVMMSSVNQGRGQAPLLDLGTKGYLPDDQWHEFAIPLSEFDDGSLDLSQIFVYCGFVAPNVQGGTFDPAATYMVDDIYFMPAQ